MVTFWKILLVNEFILWRKPHLLLSTTCDEILSWMIEIWMENHLVDDSNCNSVNLKSPPIYLFIFKYFLQGTTHNVGLTFSLGDTMPRFTIGSVFGFLLLAQVGQK
jgi:hypothetical protein